LRAVDRDVNIGSNTVAVASWPASKPASICAAPKIASTISGRLLGGSRDKAT
jgi:hypothetical protein